ncbi:MAG TPA: hypothetical protein VIG50_08790, partial [Vicinamibacteria bacterium]
ALGQLPAAEVNTALRYLRELVTTRGLPPKVLIVHQFTLGMLPDKQDIAESPGVDLVLDMDGFGSQALKRATYGAILRQRRLEFSGMKLFYEQDDGLLSPAQVMALDPAPAVVVYQ